MWILPKQLHTSDFVPDTEALSLVETLMGLPVGWVMPSCKSPVTIEPTNFDSSATESCLPPQSALFAF